MRLCSGHGVGGKIRGEVIEAGRVSHEIKSMRKFHQV